MEGGAEIRLFDPQRNPSEWTDLLQPHQCAVLAKGKGTSLLVSASDGTPFVRSGDATCIVFEGLDSAQRFCEAKAQVLPAIRFEIYDAQGLANPPLMVIGDMAPASRSRFGWKSAAALLTIAVLLFWVGARESNVSILAVFLGINCVFVALRFLHWEYGAKDAEKERLRRVEERRRKERS